MQNSQAREMPVAAACPARGRATNLTPMPQGAENPTPDVPETPASEPALGGVGSPQPTSRLPYLLFLPPVVVLAITLPIILFGGHGQPSQSEPAAMAPSASGLASTQLPVRSSVDDEALDFEGILDPETPHETKPKATYHTVSQAAARTCSTHSVDGLSLQLIAEVRCLKPDALVPLPKRANLSLDPDTFPYLQRAAAEHLGKALAASSKTQMTLHSAVRTLAQQYLVYRWGAHKTCGVQLAARPGTSNHEIGLALDIGEPKQWRPKLEAQGFRWLGKSDKVHFDYRGKRASSNRATDILAFQKLWNLNHPDDEIKETGKYDSATEDRLAKSPARGFPKAPHCGK
jgi:LAS superfamily LD-carboxypeptidase LdcB